MLINYLVQILITDTWESDRELKCCSNYPDSDFQYSIIGRKFHLYSLAAEVSLKKGLHDPYGIDLEGWHS